MVRSMQTVNFKCGHCGQLMAVGREFLGQQVRCPHCQQVVLAPSSDPAPAAPSPFGGLHEHEDIFTNKSETEDVLFGGGGDAHRLEMPHDPSFGSNGPAPDLAPVESSPELPELAPSTFSPMASPPELPRPQEPAHWSPAVPAAPSVQQPFSPPRPRQARGEGLVSPVFLLLVFAPTLLWALGATGICFWLYGHVPKKGQGGGQQKNQFDDLIDDGDAGGVRAGAAVGRKSRPTEKFATAPLPDHLKTKLGQPLEVGSLRVTPLGVSRSIVKTAAERSNTAEPCEYASLRLDLKFENLSSEYSFAPLDNYFDRKYVGIGSPPLTLLEAGDKRIFGGAHEWVPVKRRPDKWKPRQWPDERQEINVSLRPGKTMTDYVSTDGRNDKTAHYLLPHRDAKGDGYRGPMLWRVHVRKGPLWHRDRLFSATTVIGVEFTDKDVKDRDVQRP